jgi:acetyl esterase
MGLRAAGVSVELLHYPGQFHGFLNFDTVLGASRDALRRIGEALAAIFNGEPAHDRTFEVADADANCHCPLGRTAVEVASYTLTAWVATEGWTSAVLRLLAPTATAACGRLLKPLMSPVTYTRRLINEQLSRMTAEQTYPVSTPKS